MRFNIDPFSEYKFEDDKGDIARFISNIVDEDEFSALKDKFPGFLANKTFWDWILKFSLADRALRLLISGYLEVTDEKDDLHGYNLSNFFPCPDIYLRVTEKGLAETKTTDVYKLVFSSAL